ncbi:isopenicillin N synthase family dioxygenase [Flavisphingomonas formosensis]|uniref:isopenicillin N synthase family dioxygenase n=1 Tax=Flavisphingomonas formosensis TaxID=861534 RepID=UPI0012FB9C4E|nr:2-oxoglutarate and iron-dependent oxygenase domain-containing protein [Sphingomonas formosensis]
MSRSERSDDDVMVAAAVDIEEIPLIDFAPFLSGNATDRARVAGEIAWACRVIGFFYLKGHGVDQAVIDRMFDQSAAFFHLPREEKMRALATRDWYRGWVPAPERQSLSRNSRLFDQYRFQLDWGPEDRPDDPLAWIFDAPNRWPEEMPAFRAAGEAYLDAMQTLSVELLRAFALGLGLPEDRFDGYFHRPPSQLSLNYYPPLPAEADLDVSNTVSHTDEGPFTILAQGAVGGLEVKRRDGAWIAAPPIPGAFTINVGDMMMWWSNGEFLSNYHRVRNRSGGERFSVPFFANPDRDVVVAPLPEMLARTGTPRYEPVKVSDHLARFYAKLERNPDDYNG